ncbi:MAG TPA: biotin--[acetyl-CoA-carboxylase] ligase [Actinomycetota bacterium]|nr:biotin--[acetyl-CoA-carboxylase] ligase [Actinomycetota bacterium]
MPDELGVDQIKASLSGTFGVHIRYFDAIGSTNTEASDWAARGAPHGSVVVTDHQTGGRGRWGRTWFSAPRKLLQFSLILRPDLEAARHGLLTAGLGVACARAIRATSRLAVQVKWPNDVVLEGRKLAGLLVESSMIAGKITVAVCGIGINVHLTAADIPDDLGTTASSLATEAARTRGACVPERARLLAAILREIELLYPSITGDPAAVLDAASELSCVLGRDVTIRHADGAIATGRAERFDDDAALMLATDEGAVRIQVGEIEQLRAS